MNLQVPVKLKPLPLGKSETILLTFKEGTKIKQILPDDFKGIIVYNTKFLNYNENPELKVDDEIEILVPLSGGGSGKDTLRSAAFLAVAFISTWATSGIPNPLTKFLVAASINLAGVALVNALIPIQAPEGIDSKTAGEVPGFSTKSLSASSNKPGSYQVFPKMYGERRVKPYYAASPYTEVVGEDQYLHFLFFLNFGPISIELQSGV
ncbi:MAG: hypothetical protein EOM04_08790, partial [Clostridia bacterium]|nr:hypothetical protein [Clostridia bacterium]